MCVRSKILYFCDSLITCPLLCLALDCIFFTFTFFSVCFGMFSKFNSKKTDWWWVFNELGTIVRFQNLFPAVVLSQILPVILYINTQWRSTQSDPITTRSYFHPNSIIVVVSKIVKIRSLQNKNISSRRICTKQIRKCIVEFPQYSIEREHMFKRQFKSFKKLQRPLLKQQKPNTNSNKNIYETTGNIALVTFIDLYQLQISNYVQISVQMQFSRRDWYQGKEIVEKKVLSIHIFHNQDESANNICLHNGLNKLVSVCRSNTS